MTEDKAKAQGVFIPNWWLAILLMPLCGAALWVVVTLTRIQTQQDNIQTMVEFRMKAIETQDKIKDEHVRDLELSIAKTQGGVEAVAKMASNKKDN